MKKDDQDFIRELITSDFKPISNPEFTSEILEKIATEKKAQLIHSSQWDYILLSPLFAHISLYTLLLLIASFIETGRLTDQVDMYIAYLLHPITMSILFASTVLFLMDVLLKKINTRCHE